MSSVKIIAADNLLKPALDAAGGKLVVVDFTATWCGPCQRIAPVYEKYAHEYPNAVFLKVDVDQCKETAASYSVTSMPTFLFMRGGVKVDTLSGADPNALRDKIKQHLGPEAEGGAAVSDTGVPGHIDLASFINKSGTNCLNESDDNKHENALKTGDACLESDCDEQLLFHVEFNQSVKIHSLRLVAPQDGRAPKNVKLFTNQPAQVDFDKAEAMQGVQALQLSAEDTVAPGQLVPLRYVKFQAVSSITFFIVDNQAGDEVTALSHLQIIGSPVMASTDMKDFKRTAGKAGESH